MKLGDAMKAVVICYSFEGNTLKVSEHLGKELNLDVIEIKPKKELKSKGFYKYVWGGRQVVFGDKPSIEDISYNFDDVDIIFLGSPIWAGTYAPPIKTFLEKGYVKNKRIAYFYTHEGGAKNAAVRGQKAIEKYNTYLGDFSVFNVIKGNEDWKEPLVKWAKNILSK